MDYPSNNTESRKNKHLNLVERMTIQIRIYNIKISGYVIGED